MQEEIILALRLQLAQGWQEVCMGKGLNVPLGQGRQVLCQLYDPDGHGEHDRPFPWNPVLQIHEMLLVVEPSVHVPYWVALGSHMEHKLQFTEPYKDIYDPIGQ